MGNQPSGAALDNALPASELANIDAVFAIDVSGSMGVTQSTRLPGKNLYQELQETVHSIALQAEKIDADGIDVVTFGGVKKAFPNVTGGKVGQLFQEVQPGGTTPMDFAIKFAIDKARANGASGKKVACLVATDGVPDDKDVIYKLLNDAGRELGRSRIGFTFMQVGDNVDAKKFLASLDDELKTDIADTMTLEEAGSQSIAQLYYSAFNG
jgi:Mg-chelatase subunit ChlD